jgi:hypothetical protein
MRLRSAADQNQIEPFPPANSNEMGPDRMPGLKAPVMNRPPVLHQPSKP